MVRHILFDLDNTLYSKRRGLEDAVSRRVLEYAAAYLGLSVGETRRIRHEAMAYYGTTLEWLMGDKNFTAVDDYFAKVHPPDEAKDLPPDPALRDFLQSLPCPFSILTNANREHADRILMKLGVADLFGEIFDICRNNFRGKPRRDVFEDVLSALGVTPEETVFVDDVPFYLSGFTAIGGRAVLMDEFDEHADYQGERIRRLEELKNYF